MRSRTLLLIGALLAVALAGCGSSTITRLPESLTAATSHGSLRYMLLVTYQGGKQCLTATYTTAPHGGHPIKNTSHICGKAAVSGHPVLIQAHTSTQSLVLDVPASGCGKVLGGAKPGALKPLVVSCTTPMPDFRVTVLPPERRLVLQGIPGAPAINFPRHVCTVGICITPLA